MGDLSYEGLSAEEVKAVTRVAKKWSAASGRKIPEKDVAFAWSWSKYHERTLMQQALDEAEKLKIEFRRASDARADRPQITIAPHREPVRGGDEDTSSAYPPEKNRRLVSVYAYGEVQRPGRYQIPEDGCVGDLLQEAGSLPTTDVRQINLSEEISNYAGSQVIFPAVSASMTLDQAIALENLGKRAAEHVLAKQNQKGLLGRNGIVGIFGGTVTAVSMVAAGPVVALVAGASGVVAYITSVVFKRKGWDQRIAKRVQSVVDRLLKSKNSPESKEQSKPQEDESKQNRRREKALIEVLPASEQA